MQGRQYVGGDCGFVERPEHPGDQSTGYSTTPHQWGSEAGFIRRARAEARD
ncbi:MAG: hypothetical protein HOP18_24380 [Deltaproteobacteria bacterium]|nr:hypothetical protein [Deltaproteobacteria bacterium]